MHLYEQQSQVWLDDTKHTLLLAVAWAAALFVLLRAWIVLQMWLDRRSRDRVTKK
jgi:hypothetical protein